MGSAFTDMRPSRRGRVSRFERRCRGVTYSMVLVAMSALLAMLALVVDVGTLCVAKQQMRNAVDAGALAGAGMLRHTDDLNVVRQEVASTAVTNAVLGTPTTLDEMQDITFGVVDDEGTWIPGLPEQGLPMVRVTARRTADSVDGPIAMSFARAFGLDSIDLTVSAIAGVTGGHRGRDPVAIAITQDASGSFTDELPDAKLADDALVGVVDDAAIDGDIIGLNRFRGSVDRMLDFTSVPDNSADIHDAVAAIEYGSGLDSGTHTATGIIDATDMLVNQAPEGTERIIVLVSDGMPQGSAEAEWSYVPGQGWVYTVLKTAEQVTAERCQAAIDAADAAAAQGITIHTVTFIQDNQGDADFNASLVRNGGFAFDTPVARDLMAILETVGHIEVGRPFIVQ